MGVGTVHTTMSDPPDAISRIPTFRSLDSSRVEWRKLVVEVVRYRRF